MGDVFFYLACFLCLFLCWVDIGLCFVIHFVFRHCYVFGWFLIYLYAFLRFLDRVVFGFVVFLLVPGFFVGIVEIFYLVYLLFFCDFLLSSFFFCLCGVFSELFSVFMQVWFCFELFACMYILVSFVLLFRLWGGFGLLFLGLEFFDMFVFGFFWLFVFVVAFVRLGRFVCVVFLIELFVLFVCVLLVFSIF